MRAEVVLNEVNSFRAGESPSDPLQGFDVVASRPVGRGVGQMDTQLGSDDGKHIGSSHSFIFVVATGAPAGSGGRPRALVVQ